MIWHNFDLSARFSVSLLYFSDEKKVRRVNFTSKAMKQFRLEIINFYLAQLILLGLFLILGVAFALADVKGLRKSAFKLYFSQPFIFWAQKYCSKIIASWIQDFGKALKGSNRALFGVYY